MAIVPPFRFDVDVDLSGPVAERGPQERARNLAYEVGGRLDRLTLACEAMWTLLREKLGVGDEELVARMNDLDLTDGQLDGKARKGAVGCPGCGRTISRRLPKCLYCGQPIVHDPFA